MKFSKIVAAIVIGFSLSTPAVAQDPGTPKALVESFHVKLLETMKRAEQLGIKGRYKFLGPSVKKTFDFKLMIALATGKHWRKASDQAKQQLQAAFSRFSIATYADRFSGYSGQTFKTISASDGPRKTVLVKTQITRPKKSPVPLTYVTRKRAGQWRIVDVLVDDGISELATRRSEYRTVLKKNGTQALVRLLNKKTARLLSR
ncbi:MAG: hypothetical protein CMM52_03290 [Rhodospirillaceae bacterium]|nr:hypothetical protein [Rhodospirillaceae bacterium]|tara:strand:- start:70007 stop:70615 length:609 start_codon:yes stop_codon:yes gene_type:complete